MASSLSLKGKIVTERCLIFHVWNFIQMFPLAFNAHPPIQSHNKKEIGAIKQTTLETKVTEVRREFNV